MAAAERSFVSDLSKEGDPRSKRAYLFISGGLGANHGLIGIDNAFRKVTGSTYIKIDNSVLSMDSHNPQRHEKQAKFIKENLEAGREVEIVTHSLGSLEATRALTLILKQNPQFFDNHERASRLTLNYCASSGFDRGLFHETKFLIKYVALGGSVNRAINAATAFPPQNMTSKELTDGMRWIFGREKPEAMLPFEDRDHNYEKLPESIQSKLSVIDDEIKDLTKRGKRWRARRKWKQRGKLVNEELQKVFDGEYEENNNREKAPDVNFAYLVKQPQVRQALKEMVTKNIYTTTSYLLKKGINLKVVGFEQDRAITRKSMQYFVDKTAVRNNKGEISYVELLGHSGLVLQAEYYVDAVTRRKADQPVL